MTAAPKFTPGPWFLERRAGEHVANSVDVFSGDGNVTVINLFTEEDFTAETRANIALIVIAPELYAKLRAFLEAFDAWTAEPEKIGSRPGAMEAASKSLDYAIADARAALAKVTP